MFLLTTCVTIKSIAHRNHKQFMSSSCFVGWLVGWSETDCSEHATYGNWPYFTIKHAIYILFVSERAQKRLKLAIYQIFGTSKTKKFFRG